MNNYIIPGTGTYVVDEMTAQDAVLKELDVGTKFLRCTAAGTLAIPCELAYGTPEFYVYKGTEASTTEINFISDSLADMRYGLWLLNNERVALRISGSYLMYSAISYILIQTWYALKPERTLDGTFSVYIKGGDFGNQYQLLDTTGGQPPNPILNNTYTTNKYQMFSFGVGDRIIPRKWLRGVVQ